MFASRNSHGSQLILLTLLVSWSVRIQNLAKATAEPDLEVVYVGKDDWDNY